MHDPAMHSGAVWIAGAAALAVVAAFVVFAHRRGEPKDLASVSDQWPPRTPENRPSIDTSKPATTGVATETFSG
jgi:hypothetical protein